MLVAFGLTTAAARDGAVPSLPESENEIALFATDVCGQLTTLAGTHGLPEAFFARLIWKESLFDPGAVSPAGAQGIAQFMPSTAKLRGLDDPFDPKQALPASAAYLAELKARFGNWGLAAAAYNAGEKAVEGWISGSRNLPYETQDYVYAITGKDAEWWKTATSDFPIPAIGGAGDFSAQCASLVMRELNPQPAPGEIGDWKPWGVVLSGGFSEARALMAFRRTQGRHLALLENEKPLIVRKRNRSMGRRLFVKVMIGRDSRAEARTLCDQLTSRGGACVVVRNR